MLRFATEDVLHQPARATIYPHLKPMCQAAINAGAHGAFLSGAGPTILAICSGATGGDIFTQTREERQENGVANAMRRAVDSSVPNTTSGRGQVLHLLAVLPGLPRRLGRPAHVRRDGDVRDARRGTSSFGAGGVRVRRFGSSRGPLATARAPALNRQFTGRVLAYVLGWRSCVNGPAYTPRSHNPDPPLQSRS